MEKDECWETFLLSGKVTDYLSYRQATVDAEFGAEERRMASSGEKKPDEMVKKHAGFY